MKIWLTDRPWNRVVNVAVPEWGLAQISAPWLISYNVFITDVADGNKNFMVRAATARAPLFLMWRGARDGGEVWGSLAFAEELGRLLLSSGNVRVWHPMKTNMMIFCCKSWTEAETQMEGPQPFWADMCTQLDHLRRESYSGPWLQGAPESGSHPRVGGRCWSH